MLSRDDKLQDIGRLMAYYEKPSKCGDATEAHETLGAPTTTLRQWCEQRRCQKQKGA
jgi:hypothetical protein